MNREEQDAWIAHYIAAAPFQCRAAPAGRLACERYLASGKCSFAMRIAIRVKLDAPDNAGRGFSRARLEESDTESLAPLPEMKPGEKQAKMFEVSETKINRKKVARKAK